jgi:hypothetical protein
MSQPAKTRFITITDRMALLQFARGRGRNGGAVLGHRLRSSMRAPRRGLRPLPPQRLLAPLRTCRTPEDVTAVLDQKVFPEDAPFKAFSAFGKRGNNSHQVRYLLARITAYVAESLGRPNEIGRYLDGWY